MAREKMFDPAFQKAFTEAIIKEKKIRDLRFVNDVSGYPRSARVDFSALYDSDESDHEDVNTQLQKEENVECESCGILPETLNEKMTLKASDSQQQPEDSNVKKEKVIDSSQEAQYVFPICSFCDFGWNYSSRKYIVCPHHGPYRRTRFGYSQPIRDYLIDQIRRNAKREEVDKSKTSKLSNNFYL